MSLSLRERVFAALDRLHPGGALGAAVSGGGDSTALALLAAEWARARGVLLRLACVDHGLRPDSAAEAARVMALAARLGCAGTVLRWRDPPRGNLQQAARAARYRLLADWGEDCGAIALGHTRDDQAETVLLNLLRGSGVDGLAAMPLARTDEGAFWIRPLLAESRAELRDFLRARAEAWVDDPSNDDPRFDRVKARQAMAALGLHPQGLVDTAARMARARSALEGATAELAARVATRGPLGEARLDLRALCAASDEIVLRLLAQALQMVSGAPRRPRLAALERLLAALRAQQAHSGRTLHGCVICWDDETARLTRESVACGVVENGVWDGRWRVAPDAPGEVAALGEEGRRLIGAPDSESWRATPALWLGEALVCAPLAGYGAGLRATLPPPPPGWRDDSAH